MDPLTHYAIAHRTCRHCDEPAIKGYTTCDRHSSPLHRAIAEAAS